MVAAEGEPLKKNCECDNKGKNPRDPKDPNKKPRKTMLGKTIDDAVEKVKDVKAAHDKNKQRKAEKKLREQMKKDMKKDGITGAPTLSTVRL